MEKLAIELTISILEIKIQALELEKTKTYQEIQELQKQLEDLTE